MAAEGLHLGRRLVVADAFLGLGEIGLVGYPLYDSYFLDAAQWRLFTPAFSVAFVLGLIVWLLALVAAGAATVLCWRRIAGPRSFALVSALVFAWFFLSAKQAFCNYYYFLGIMVLAAAASRDEVLSSPGHGG